MHSKSGCDCCRRGMFILPSHCLLPWLSHPPPGPYLRHHKGPSDGKYGAVVKGLAEFYRQHKEQLPPLTIWRDNTPQHFGILHGEFPSPDDKPWEILGGFKGCKPIKVGPSLARSVMG